MKNTDAWLYVAIAVCPPVATCLGTDEAKNFIRPDILFWLKTSIVVFGAGVTALKAYRSTSFQKPTETPKL